MINISDVVNSKDNSFQGGKLSSASGNFNGQRVIFQGKEASILEKIQDSAEEVTFFNKKGEDEKLKKAKEESNRSSIIKNKQDVQQLKDFLDSQNSDLSLDLLQEAKIQILVRGNSSSMNLANILNKFFPDVSHQFLALIYLEHSLDSNDQLKKMIKKMRKDLEEENGPEIYAGLNITKEGLKFVRGDKSKMPQVRKFYRQNILGYQTLSDVYRNMINEYGSGKFFDSLDFLLSALGADLNSSKSSLSDIQLKPIIDDIVQLQQLKTINEYSAETISFLKKFYKLREGANSISILDFILPIIADDYISIDGLEEFCSLLGIDDEIEAKIACSNCLNKSINNVPEKVFRDNYSKENILSTIHNYSIVLYEEEVS